MSTVDHAGLLQPGFGQSLGLGRKQALVMIDFAKAYFVPGAPLYAARPEVLARAAELLAWARARKMPIIHTRVEFDREGVTGGVFFRKIAALAVFCEGSEMGQFAEGVEPAADEVVVTKQYASAFFGSSLASTLNGLGVDCIIIAGMSTSGCVRATGVDAIQYGYIPVVLSDCVGDKYAEVHDANLFDLGAKYADVMSFDELRQQLGER